jgi:hypothetical protein
LKTLLHYIAGAVFCIGLGSAAFIFRVPLRGRGKEFGPLEQVLAAVVIGIGVVYAFLAVRECLAWRDERRPPRSRKRRP